MPEAAAKVLVTTLAELDKLPASSILIAVVPGPSHDVAIVFRWYSPFLYLLDDQQGGHRLPDNQLRMFGQLEVVWTP